MICSISAFTAPRDAVDLGFQQRMPGRVVPGGAGPLPHRGDDAGLGRGRLPRRGGGGFEIQAEAADAARAAAYALATASCGEGPGVARRALLTSSAFRCA